MASGWTNSGINWTSAATMRNSRTENIIREIYLAVSERDHWITHFTGVSQFGFTTPSIDTTGRIRFEQAYKYIYDVTKKWITPFADIDTGGMSLVLGSHSCYLDETAPFDPVEVINSNFIPFLPKERWFGIKNLDYSIGGTLESLLSNLSVYRSSYNSRVDLNFLFLVYNLLNLELKISGTTSQKYLNPDTDGAIGRSISPSFSDTSSDFYGFGYTKSSTEDASSGSSQDFLDLAINNYNVDPFTYLSGSSFFSEEDISAFTRNNGSGGGGVSHRYQYFKYIETGYDTNLLDLSNVEMTLKSYGYLEKPTFPVRDDFYNYMPKGDRVIGGNTINPILENINGVDVFRVSSLISTPLPLVSAPPNGDNYADNFKEGVINPFFNITKQEGFLNYYTEP